MTRRSYGQYCGLARALDVVGDRWSLLVVRELLIAPARYGELLAALPGIATNLLSQRLRTLETAGLVERAVATDANAVAYRLTGRGAGLREPVEALVRWSEPLMTTGRGTDAFDPRWLVVALRGLLAGRAFAHPAVIGLDVDGTLIAVEVGRGGALVDLACGRDLPAVLRAGPEVVLGLATGALGVEQAIAAGELTGSSRAVRSVFAGRGRPAPALGDGDGDGDGPPRPSVTRDAARARPADQPSGRS